MCVCAFVWGCMGVCALCVVSLSVCVCVCMGVCVCALCVVSLSVCVHTVYC